MSLRIGLVYDLKKEYLAAGYSKEQVAEFDSEETIEAFDRTIRSLGYEVQRIGNARSLCSRLAAGERWDLVFNIAEGVSGRAREAQVPCILEVYGIPYTFSDPLVAAVTMDKAVAKRLVREAGLNTPDFLVVQQLSDLHDCSLKFPLFAKPIAEGTGKGIDRNSRIESMQELETICRSLLARFGEPVLVEEFLPGREFTVGILGTGPAARILGAMEIKFLKQTGSDIYSFEIKEKYEQFVSYAPLDDAILRGEVETLALGSYLTLDCRDAARADIRLDSAGRPSFMEINTLPGLHPIHSDLPIIARQEGMSYTELIGAIISSAMQRIVK